MPLTQQPWGSIPSLPRIFSEEKILDAAEVYQRRWSEESVDSGLIVLIEPIQFSSIKETLGVELPIRILQTQR